MSDRRDYYFRQKVTESELDAGFDGLEQADRDLAADHALTGIVSGGEVSEKAGTPNISVDVQGPAVVYDRDGQRCQFSGTQNQDVSVDDGAASTSVTTPGNEKWVSLFIEFDRVLSDPRIDGNSLTVFFVREESFAFSVVQGSEAAVGVATRPPLDPNKILLADINRTFGQTQILNADISTTRRESAVKFVGGVIEVDAGTPAEGVGQVLDGLLQHIAGVAGAHPASAITNAPAGTIAATTVQAAIDELASDKFERSGANTLSGNNLFTGQNRFNQAPRLLTDGTPAGTFDPIYVDAGGTAAFVLRTLMVPLFEFIELSETQVVFIANQNVVRINTASSPVRWPLRLPHGAMLIQVRTAVDRGGSGGTAMQLNVERLQHDKAGPSAATRTSLGSSNGASSSPEILAVGGLTETIDNTGFEYYVHVSSSSTAGATADDVLWVEASFRDFGLGHTRL